MVVGSGSGKVEVGWGEGGEVGKREDIMYTRKRNYNPRLGMQAIKTKHPCSGNLRVDSLQQGEREPKVISGQHSVIP